MELLHIAKKGFARDISLPEDGKLIIKKSIAEMAG